MKHYPLCGCFYVLPGPASVLITPVTRRQYLPLVESEVHSTILSTISRTTLQQKFTNPSTTEAIKQCFYLFPLFDGVSVVDFTCRIDSKVIHGVVKEKEEAEDVFNQALASDQMAGYLEQSNEAGDVFQIKLGNIPAGKTIHVQITYIGELNHHGSDGIKFTIPTSIAPRYGSGPSDAYDYNNLPAHDNDGMKITVDINLPDDSIIKSIQSPSHPIAVSMGTLQNQDDGEPKMSKGSATLSQGSTALEKDFVLIVESKDIGTPKALLETHDTIANQRALMVTLVPKFVLPQQSKPEIVFVTDRSGSMRTNMRMLVSAMQVFLKSLPTGVNFNICSFGSSHSFLWPRSLPYNRENLDKALHHITTFQADMGGTETFRAIQATIESRNPNLPLQIMLLTDGDVWQQEQLFHYVNEQVKNTKGNIRIFPLGIGSGVSSSLIEGLARAGNGFAQSVQYGERLDKPVVRMVKGALSPHITDYTMEVKYKKKEGDDFEMIEKTTDGMIVLLSDKKEEPLISAEKCEEEPKQKPTISLFNPNVDAEREPINNKFRKVDPLPVIPAPNILQAPHKIGNLFAFSRTVVYLLMSPKTAGDEPASVTLRATSSHGPLELEIPVEVLPRPGQTIHQLAAKKALQDLEEGRGWIFDAEDQDCIPIKEKFDYCFHDLVQREAVRLGVQFQITGRWTSFVAVAEKTDIEEDKLKGKARKVAVTPSSSKKDKLQTHNGRPLAQSEDDDDDCEIYLGNGTASHTPPAPICRTGPPHYYVSLAALAPSFGKSLNPSPQVSRGSFGNASPSKSFSAPLFGSAMQASQLQQSLCGTATVRREALNASATFLTPPGNGAYGMQQAQMVKTPANFLPRKKKAVARRSSVRDRVQESEEIPSEPVSGSKTNEKKVLRLISLQDFEGYWDAKSEAELSNIMEIGADNTLPASPSDVAENRAVWITLLVIAFLRDKVADEMDIWELVVEKGVKWVKGEIGDEEVFERLEKGAKGIVNGN
ncbi:hypothetical protein B7463_g7098, partial [Scytalidium lignicola]